MTKLYLITGFLGAGKTTFLHQLVRQFPGQRLSLIVNEFGKTGVDGTLLQDLGVALREINNGSIFCACNVGQFEDAVATALDSHPDCILVEASGLADPTSVRTVLGQAAFAGRLDYAGAICLADGMRFHKVYQTARVCKMQLAVADLVLINKADLASRDQLDAIAQLVHSQKPHCPVYETTFGHIEPVWLESLTTAPDSGSGEIHTRDITLQKLTLTVDGFDLSSLTSFLRMFAEDTYRVKGFVQLPEGLYLADCVGPLVEVRPFSGAPEALNQLVVLFGNGLHAKKSIKAAKTWYPNCTVDFT